MLFVASISAIDALDKPADNPTSALQVKPEAWLCTKAEYLPQHAQCMQAIELPEYAIIELQVFSSGVVELTLALPDDSTAILWTYAVSLEVQQ